MEGLRDIKDIVEVHESSLQLFILTIIALLLAIALAIYLYKNRRIRKRKATPKEIAKQNLKNIDFSNTKNAIYSFCEDGRYFIDDKNRDLFQSIEQEVEKYKYKRDIPNLDEGIKEDMKKFIGGIK